MSALKAVLRWPADRRDALGLALWDAGALAEATGGTVSGPFQCAGVEIDSRDVRSGDLFFALKGESTDGHRFIDKAFANGAAAAVVDRPIEQPHVLVRDTSEAL
jgi:UDP-N-acetylmuramoyl-tripeptide--D-alanyl-D-alanine ligase